MIVFCSIYFFIDFLSKVSMQWKLMRYFFWFHLGSVSNHWVGVFHMKHFDAPFISPTFSDATCARHHIWLARRCTWTLGGPQWCLSCEHMCSATLSGAIPILQGAWRICLLKKVYVTLLLWATVLWKYRDLWKFSYPSNNIHRCPSPPT